MYSKNKFYQYLQKNFVYYRKQKFLVNVNQTCNKYNRVYDISEIQITVLKENVMARQRKPTFHKLKQRCAPFREQKG